jgi:hypothetical protein
MISAGARIGKPFLPTGALASAAEAGRSINDEWALASLGNACDCSNIHLQGRLSARILPAKSARACRPLVVAFHAAVATPSVIAVLAKPPHQIDGASSGW